MVYAHSANEEGNWHRWDKHAVGTARLAAEFAAKFGCRDLGWCIGAGHDIGKVLAKFQAYLRGFGNGQPHAPISASYFLRAGLSLNHIYAAFVSAGHHTGLSSPADLRGLTGRWEVEADAVDSCHAYPARITRRLSKVKDPPDFKDEPYAKTLFIRMLFSAVVDADYLSTEAHFDAPRAKRRRRPRPSMERLAQRLDDHLARLTATAVPTTVNKARAEVQAACRHNAGVPHGVWSLTVPTGGGKTLSGLLFALQHAKQHGKERVIIVLPYTAIIEQTAKVLKSILGHANVLEHHSAAWMDSGDRMAAENWDAPVIVTTNVQFFESLFSNRPKHCRKLHNIARSVVIFDECQTLPPRVLIPTLNCLRALTSHFGCTLVFSTATQPAFQHTRTSKWGLHDIRELVGSPRAVKALFATLRRVKVDWSRADVTTTLPELAREVSHLKSVLVIVATRKHAQDLTALVDQHAVGERCFHLSTSMCPQHRRAVLAEIRMRLKQGVPTRVVSTSLLEAGVDIDFPVVYRAIAGLDSLAQAAGRCNREGRLDFGEVRVFRLDGTPPTGMADAIAVTELLTREGGGARPDILDSEVHRRFYQSLYTCKGLDRRTQEAEDAQKFNVVSPHVEEPAEEAYRIIHSAQVDVLVPYGNGVALIDRIVRGDVESLPYRKLRAFTVSMYPTQLTPNMYDVYKGEVPNTGKGARAYSFNVLTSAYDERFGVVISPEGKTE